jgi:N-formylglutamate deformylase
MPTFSLHAGTQPLLVSLPHNGTGIPQTLQARMTETALRRPDTDWHVARLYDFARELGASILVPQYSRYVVDLNRPPDGAALYPGQSETGLCPTITFAGQSIYLDGEAPGDEEVRDRVDRYWRPYHAALHAELERLHSWHGRAVLWDGHSIRSQVPMFFTGQLSDLNLGTASGHSCSPAMQQRLVQALQTQTDFDYAVNGRFKGGYITRHYGQPEIGVEAVQLELSQRTYMDESSFVYDSDKASKVKQVIKLLLSQCLQGAG